LENKIDGIHYLISSDSLGYWVTDNLLYKYPCSQNEFFTYGRNDHDTTFVISIDDTIMCKAGTYSCIVYENKIKGLDGNTTGYINTYVAYGIGKVKYEVYLYDSKAQLYKSLEYTLLNYNLN
jgi:hypothetical protein